MSLTPHTEELRRRVLSAMVEMSVTLEVFNWKRKSRVRVALRDELAWRVMNDGKTRPSYPELASAMGARGHASVYDGVKRHEKRVKRGIAA